MNECSVVLPHPGKDPYQFPGLTETIRIEVLRQSEGKPNTIHDPVLNCPIPFEESVGNAGRVCRSRRESGPLIRDLPKDNTACLGIIDETYLYFTRIICTASAVDRGGDSNSDDHMPKLEKVPHELVPVDGLHKVIDRPVPGLSPGDDSSCSSQRINTRNQQSGVPVVLVIVFSKEKVPHGLSSGVRIRFFTFLLFTKKPRREIVGDHDHPLDGLLSIGDSFDILPEILIVLLSRPLLQPAEVAVVVNQHLQVHLSFFLGKKPAGIRASGFGFQLTLIDR